MYEHPVACTRMAPLWEMRLLLPFWTTLAHFKQLEGSSCRGPVRTHHGRWVTSAPGLVTLRNA